jgi:hypothetical protein
VQKARDVGPNLDTRAYFAQLGSFFEQLHRRTVARQSQRCGKPANATARDQNLFETRFCHGRILPW